MTLRVEPALTEQHMTELFNEFNLDGHRVTMLGDRWLKVHTADKEPERWLREREYVVEHAQWKDRRPSTQRVHLEVAR